MIPEEAVEAAARAMYDSTAHDGDWDEIATEDEKATSRSYARAALEAAAPHMLAKAWQEGFKQGGPMHDVNYDDPDAHTRNPYGR